jgi:hypothetical protein
LQAQISNTGSVDTPVGLPSLQQLESIECLLREMDLIARTEKNQAAAFDAILAVASEVESILPSFKPDWSKGIQQAVDEASELVRMMKVRFCYE